MIVMKDIIIIKKVRKKKLWNDIIDKIALTKVAQNLSFIYLILRYKWVINNANIAVVKKLGPTELNKYSKYVSQVELELN